MLHRLRQHFSFAILAGGAAVFFGSNVLLKLVFTPEDYGLYSIVVTYISALYLYGVLGLEQVLVRYAQPLPNNVIAVPRYVAQCFAWAIGLSTCIGVVFFKRYCDSLIHIPLYLLVLASVSAVCLMWVYNLFRLNAHFCMAQWTSNLWKYVLFALAVGCYLNHNIRVQDCVYALLGGVILNFLSMLAYLWRNLQIKLTETTQKGEIIQTGGYFFISISVFTALTFADRFLIENKFGVAALGHYFYLTNLFLAPFALLQNYVGFKQLVAFKQYFTPQVYKAFARKTLLLGIIMALVGYGVIQIPWLQRMLQVHMETDRNMVLFLLVLGVIRLHSSAITTAFEIRSALHNLKRFNYVGLVLTMAGLALANLFAQSIIGVLWVLALLWLSRSLIGHYLLMQQVCQENEID